MSDFSYLRCLNPGCRKLRACRGLCRACYDRFRLAVREGRDSDALALSEGRLLPINREKHRQWGKRLSNKKE